jgi:hypothetical protein
LVASRAVPAGIHFWVSGIALAAMNLNCGELCSSLWVGAAFPAIVALT